MASYEHISSAQFIKNTHLALRNLSKEIGYEEAWEKHCNNLPSLQEYAKNMKYLATNCWEKKDSHPVRESRIVWMSNFCLNYFINGGIHKYRNRENEIANKINLKYSFTENAEYCEINVLDVGSCYNPFKSYSFMKVLPIDLYSADNSVFVCDFLNVLLGQTIVEDKQRNSIKQLPENDYDAIMFSLLLEYLPSSYQRKECCKRAYKLLKTEGILIIASPDSNHIGANVKIMKNWRYTLSLMGFSRICYEKLQHLHCMVFRKSMDSQIAERWAKIYKEDYMEDEIFIPQDLQSTEKLGSENLHENYLAVPNSADNLQDFQQLPFCKDDEESEKSIQV